MDIRSGSRPGFEEKDFRYFEIDIEFCEAGNFSELKFYGQLESLKRKLKKLKTGKNIHRKTLSFPLMPLSVTTRRKGLSSWVTNSV
jgi:hypothetical protein